MGGPRKRAGEGTVHVLGRGLLSCVGVGPVSETGVGVLVEFGRFLNMTMSDGLSAFSMESIVMPMKGDPFDLELRNSCISILESVVVVEVTVLVVVAVVKGSPPPSRYSGFRIDSLQAWASAAMLGLVV